MKRYIVFFFPLFFSNVLTAQQNLGVGDDAPEFKVFQWIKGEPLSSLPKGQVHLIEFGATWCTPCARAIPELSRMADEFKGKVTVISVFVMEPNDHKNDAQPNYVRRVENYVTKKADKIRYNIAVDDPQKTMERLWLKRAGLEGIPQMFVIDHNGKIAGIETSPEAAYLLLKEVVSRQYNVQEMIERTRLSEATSVKYDRKKLLLIDGNGGHEKNFLFRSILTAYDGRIRVSYPTLIESHRFGSGDTIYNHLKDRVQVIGASIGDLYYLAYSDTLTKLPYSRNLKNEYPDTVARPHRKSVYGQQWHMPIVEVMDKSPFIVDRKQVHNRYNYSLKVPEGAGTAAYLQHCMRSDLNKFFGYQAKIQKRKMPVWQLTVMDYAKFKKAVSSDQSKPFENNSESDPFVFTNAEMRDIIWMLGTNYGYPPYNYGKVMPEDQVAFIDATDIKVKIDFIYDKRWSFDQMKEYLATLGLAIEKSKKLMSVVVISD